jgi:hypothetical protein
MIGTLLVEACKNHSRETIKRILQEFAQDNEAYALYYSNDILLKEYFEEIQESSESIEWWPLNWRSVVPLYLAGFRVAKLNESDDDDEHTAEIIASLISKDYINLGTPGAVSGHISQFKLAQRTLSDEDSDGILDVACWMDGTIHPDWLPRVQSL